MNPFGKRVGIARAADALSSAKDPAVSSPDAFIRADYAETKIDVLALRRENIRRRYNFDSGKRAFKLSHPSP